MVINIEIIYIVYNNFNHEAAIIDPACEISIIDNVIDKYKIRLSKILITHTHIDHVRTVNEILHKYNAEVYISNTEFEYYKYRCDNMICLNDDEKIAFGDCYIKCIETPGHTYGSSCYLIGDMLFTGDTIFIEGCGECNGDGASPYKMYFSIRKLKSTILGSTKIYPGHTYFTQPGKTMSYIRENNLYFIIDNIDEFVDFRMREGQKGLYEFI